MEIKFAVDRIIDDIVVLENLETGKISYIYKSFLDFDVQEKDIIIHNNNTFYKDLDEYNIRVENIKEKFERLKRK